MRRQKRVGVNVTAEVDGEPVSGHFDFWGEPDEEDLEACREILRALYRRANPEP